MFRISIFTLLAGIAALPARANHDTAETILQFWQKSEARLHVLQPAKSVRALPVSTRKPAVAREAERHLREALAIVVVEGGEIVYESYANGATAASPLRSYSMTKSFTALAVGEALCAGKIRSLEDKAGDYVPEIADTAYGRATIRNLLRFTSGAQDPGGEGFSGVHNPDDFRAVNQHQIAIINLLKKYGGQSRFKQGEKFIYNGLDSQTLGLVVRGATGKPLQRWYEETVWQKAGAEFPGGWYPDKDGNGYGEILMLATARDFARVGLYVLERLSGKANDPCVSEFLREAAKAQASKGYWPWFPTFGLGLHQGKDGNPWMTGHGGQRIGINPGNGRVLAILNFKEWRGYDQDIVPMLSR